jgi:hypothetical protein
MKHALPQASAKKPESSGRQDLNYFLIVKPSV